MRNLDVRRSSSEASFLGFVLSTPPYHGVFRGEQLRLGGVPLRSEKHRSAEAEDSVATEGRDGRQQSLLASSRQRTCTPPCSVECQVQVKKVISGRRVFGSRKVPLLNLEANSKGGNTKPEVMNQQHLLAKSHLSY